MWCIIHFHEFHNSSGNEHYGILTFEPSTQLPSAQPYQFAFQATLLFKPFETHESKVTGLAQQGPQWPSATQTTQSVF